MELQSFTLSASLTFALHVPYPVPNSGDTVYVTIRKGYLQSHHITCQEFRSLLNVRNRVRRLRQKIDFDGRLEFTILNSSITSLVLKLYMEHVLVDDGSLVPTHSSSFCRLDVENVSEHSRASYQISEAELDSFHSMYAQFETILEHWLRNLDNIQLDYYKYNENHPSCFPYELKWRQFMVFWVLQHSYYSCTTESHNNGYCSILGERPTFSTP